MLLTFLVKQVTTKWTHVILDTIYAKKQKKWPTIIRQKYPLIPSRDIDHQRILESDWPKGTTGLHPTKSGSLDEYLLAKKLNINWFFPVLLLIKESFNLIGWETKLATLNQEAVVSGEPPSLNGYIHAKETETILFLPEILIIKESCNLFRWAVQLTKPKQKGESHMLHSLDDYLHAKNLRDWLIPARDIDDQRIDKRQNWSHPT